MSELGKCDITMVIDGEASMHSGGHLSGVATLQIQRNAVDADALRIRIMGAEKLSYKTVEKVNGGQDMSTDTQLSLVCCDAKQVISLQPGGLAIGSYDYPFNLPIPANSPGTQRYQHGTTSYAVVYTLELSLEKAGVAFNAQVFKFDLPIRCMPVPSNAISKEPYQHTPCDVPMKFLFVPTGHITIVTKVDTLEVKRGDRVITTCSIVNNTRKPSNKHYTLHLMQVMSFPDEDGVSPLTRFIDQVIAPIHTPSETSIPVAIPAHLHPCYKGRVCTMVYKVVVKMGSVVVGEIPINVH